MALRVHWKPTHRIGGAVRSPQAGEVVIYFRDHRSDISWPCIVATEFAWNYNYLSGLIRFMGNKISREENFVDLR